MTTWLVTGGAGYIGAHVVRALVESGRNAVVIDDLSTGHARKVPDGVPLINSSVLNVAAVADALSTHRVDGVVHLAAKKVVLESIERPLLYYRENVGGMVALLEAMRQTNVRRLVYSSSAAVYGEAATSPVTEDTVPAPSNPYGETKVVGEWLCRAEGTARELSWAALRYFNVAGAASPELGDVGVENLIPMVFRALDRGEHPQVFGDDYPTPDGTCIRDYIHVADLAEAHVAAAHHLERVIGSDILNVGRGAGASVRDVLRVVADVIGQPFDVDVTPRRTGDIPVSFASTARINELLGWSAQHDLVDMVRSAWEAWQAHKPA